MDPRTWEGDASRVDRRAWLAGAAALAWGRAALGQQPAARAPEGVAAPRPALRKSLKVGMIQAGTSLAEKFAAARAAGFEGVELDSPGDLDLDEARAAAASSGLVIEGVVDSAHWQDTLGDADAAVRARGRAALERALRDCALVGGDSVLLVPAVVSPSIPYDQAWERSTAEIRAVLPLASELRVKIALENVWNHFLLSPLEAARYVDQFESPWLGWHFDIGNVVNTGWPDQWIRILGARIVKLDVKAFSRKRRDGQGLWKGFEAEIGDEDDDCGWPAVMRALADIGYRGWAAAEVRGGDGARLADVARRMDRVFAL